MADVSDVISEAALLCLLNKIIFCLLVYPTFLQCWNLREHIWDAQILKPFK